MLALAACGDSGSVDTTTQASTVAAQKPAPKKPSARDPYNAIVGVPKPPKVYVPPGPAPDHLVIKDLKEGWGPVVKPKSRLALNFIGIDYASRKPFETQWRPKNPFVFEFDHGLELQGWEEGLPGMKVGGRRKLIVPSELAYNEGDVVYVVDLLAVEDRSRYARPSG